LKRSMGGHASGGLARRRAERQVTGSFECLEVSHLKVPAAQA